MEGDSWDSLVRMARWGLVEGKRNIIADLGSISDMAAEIDQLRVGNKTLGVKLDEANAEIARLKQEAVEAALTAELTLSDFILGEDQ